MKDTTTVIDSNGYDESAFDLLPTVDELNDCRSDIEKEFDEFAAEDTDRDARFNHGERHAAKLTAKLRKFDPTAKVTYDIDEDDKDTFFMTYDGICGGVCGTLDAAEDAFHDLKKTQAEIAADPWFNRNRNMKELSRDAIRDMLAKEVAVLNDDIFDGEILRSTLYDAGYTCVAEEFSYAEEYALAAALEYFDGDIEQAIAAIERGDYRHFPDVFTYEELGTEIAIGTMGGRYLPQLIVDYLDTETLGKDTANGERGQFTRFGYFAPEV